ncbi:MAG: ribosomal-processing cysteine protease Prp [Deltaproteobacteria bacterium]
MIVVSIKRSKDGTIKDFAIDGHAGFDKAGKDIVCAGVSAVSGTAIIGLERLLDINPVITIDSEKGYLKCSIPDDISAEKSEYAQVILETMVLGIRDISEKYKKFIRLSDKEV